jgi:hypothetical protein
MLVLVALCLALGFGGGYSLAYDLNLTQFLFGGKMKEEKGPMKEVVALVCAFSYPELQIEINHVLCRKGKLVDIKYADIGDVTAYGHSVCSAMIIYIPEQEESEPNE